MVGKYKVITLCGSTRFKDESMEAQKRLTLEGYIVISVGLFGHSGDNEVWENMDEGTLTRTKEMLDDMHKRKIDMADEIFVINVGGYIGTSTRSEIDYARARGKNVRYLESTVTCSYDLSVPGDHRKDLPMDNTSSFTPAIMPTVLDIRAIYSIHYFEYAKGFSFAGERHDFWEFIFVDKGKVSITAGEREILLQKDEIAFHQPMEFHAVHARGFAPNLIVISFRCTSPAMDYFKGKVLTVNEEERAFLASIISHAGQGLACRMDDPYLKKLTFRPDASPEIQQLILLDLTSFLLHLLLRCRSEEMAPGTSVTSYGKAAPTFVFVTGNPRKQLPVHISKTTTVNSQRQLYDRLENYLRSHLSDSLNISQICKDNLISKSLLCSIYKRETGQGVIEHYNQMKIEQAKILLRSSDMTVTQIADHLGYTTVQYFSRQFRSLTGMCPSEYATSVKALSEKMPVSHRDVLSDSFCESQGRSF